MFMFRRMIHSNEAPRVSQCPCKGSSAFTKRVTSYRAAEKCQTAFAGILQAGCLWDPGALWVCLHQFIWYNREDWRVFVLHGRFQRSPSDFPLPPILQRCDRCCKNLLAVACSQYGCPGPPLPSLLCLVWPVYLKCGAVSSAFTFCYSFC